MAKNLKLKVKNTQLAEALKKSKLKKEEQSASLITKPQKQTKTKEVKKTTPEHKTVKATNQKTALSPDEKKPLKEEKKEASVPSKPIEKIATPKKSPSVSQIAPKPKEKESPKQEKKQSSKDIKKPSFNPPAPSLNKEPSEGFRPTFGRLAKTKTKRFDSRDRQGLRINEERSYRKRPSKKRQIHRQPIQIIRPKELTIRLPISIKDLSQAMKLKASELIEKFLMQGLVLTLNDILDDPTTVQLLGEEFECKIFIDTSEQQRLRITDKTIQEEIAQTPPENLEERPPIIAFMGHVDHGKTSLIDAIRKSNIATSEAGAITQHIGAFQCHRDQGNLTILDTPGHEAFAMMRMRGATITDIIVLVVAGDEGIMPQTEEAITYSKENHIPLVVAINKSDKENFNVENVYRQLSKRDLLPEAWGGPVITVNCSASTGEGIPDLLEMLFLQAQILELKANPNTRARGTVIESQLHKGLGAVGTILIQNGTLRLGDALVIEEIYARIKTMHDEHGKPLQIALPSTPVKITGLSGVPEAGNEFIAVKNEKMAKKLCIERASGAKRAIFQTKPAKELESLMERHQELSKKKIVNLIIRADVQGSVEALKTSLLNIKSKKVELSFIDEGVGEISESDVELAVASQAVIIGFHTQVESHAEDLIKREKVTIKKHNIIYQVIDDVKQLMLKSLDKIKQENEIGTLEVRKIFKSSQLGSIAGCYVTAGLIKRSQYIKLFRDNQLVWEGNLASLKREKEDVKEVHKGLECGVLLEKFNAIEIGDLIKAFEITYIQQEL